MNRFCDASQTLFRFLVSAVSAISALYFVFWVGGAVLALAHGPLWLSTLMSLAAAVAVGRYVWARTASPRPGLINSIVVGAFVIGGIGFAGGFFGPIVFMPDANQGPLLGIFITGPLGFVLGGVGGAIHWMVRGRQRAAMGPA